MARPKTREQLLSQSQENYDRLFSLVDSLNPEDRNRSGVNGEWSVKDILAHLAAWHQLFFTWYQEGSQGLKPAIPAKGYSWKTTPDLNEKIYLEHRDRSYDAIVDELASTHEKMMDIISGHSDEELFTKKLYKWTGSTSLGSYAVSASSSHYHWASELIRKWMRSLPKD